MDTKIRDNYYLVIEVYMSEKRKYKSYSKEFKEDAVLLVLEHGYSVAKAAEAVGVRERLLYLWKQKYEEQQHPQQLSSDEKAELLSYAKRINNYAWNVKY